MAYAAGTVSDYNDFLTKLIAFASGTDATTWSGWTSGGVVPSGQVWTVLANSIPASGNLTTQGIAYLQGQGSEAGDNIIVGFRTYSNAPDFVFGAEIRGYTEYDATLTWDTMPGVSPSCWAAFAGVSFQAWFWVNGRRILATARVGGLYDITFMVGFFLPYGTHSQYPYPLLISGSMVDNTQPYTRADLDHSCIPDPGGFNGVYFRWIDGTWQGICHYGGAAPNLGYRSTQGNAFALYPHVDQSPSDGAEYGGQQLYGEMQLIQNWSIGGAQFSAVEVNAYPLLPIVINSSNQLPGQLDGIYYVPGNGLNPGDTLTIGGVIYDVFHNCWRSNAFNFYCMPRV